MMNRLYDGNEMVKVGCNDCQGCCDCCCGMGESIILDPYDIYLLETRLHCGLEDLLQEQAELQVANGLVLPNLKMAGEKECCGFLDASGRCGIHEFRPGLCRLFPLGREYKNGELKYFVLENVCKNQNQTKIKIKKWLDVPDLRRYEGFLIQWHALKRELQQEVPHMSAAQLQRMNMKLLGIFYTQPYETNDFYILFARRMEQWKQEYEEMRKYEK